MTFSRLIFPPLSSPDYLNNLSPDSKEYEDTQGKASAGYISPAMMPRAMRAASPQPSEAYWHAAAAPHASEPYLWSHSHRVCVNWIGLCINLPLLSFLCLRCSCLGDRVRGGGPGQRQSEAGGEFTLDTLRGFRAFAQLPLSLKYIYIFLYI